MWIIWMAYNLLGEMERKREEVAGSVGFEDFIKGFCVDKLASKNVFLLVLDLYTIYKTISLLILIETI